jgi:hypothetical protein
MISSLAQLYSIRVNPCYLWQIKKSCTARLISCKSYWKYSVTPGLTLSPRGLASLIFKIGTQSLPTPGLNSALIKNPGPLV